MGTAYELYPSRSGHSDRIALFSAPLVDNSYECEEIIRYKPTTSLNSQTGPIHFLISNISPRYISLCRSRLVIECKVVQGDGTPITDESQPDDSVVTSPRSSKVGLVNNFLHSLWSSAEFSLQNQVMSPHVGNNYHYKAIIDVLCRNTQSPGELFAQMYVKDSYEMLKDVSSGLEAANPAQAVRRSMANSSRTFTLSGVLNHDICKQPRLLLNNVSIGLRLQPNKDSFVLCSNIKVSSSNPAPDFKVQITDASYDICYVRPNSGVLLSQDKILHGNKRAMYPHLRSDVKTYSIATGSRTFSCDDIWSSYVPCDVFVCFIDSEAYSGNYLKYPYRFESVKITRIGLFIDGQSQPSKPYETKFDPEHWNLGSYTDAYIALLGHDPSQCNITYEEFGENFTIFRFPLERYTGTVFPKAKRGHARLEVTFDDALPKNYTILIYSLFSSYMEIDSSRNIFMYE